MSGLAERIETDYELIGLNGWQPIFDEVMDNMPTVLTALRFAEDMQTLESVDVQIERGDQPDDQWLITISTDEGEVQFQDRSLMVAARAAAQAIGGV